MSQTMDPPTTPPSRPTTSLFFKLLAAFVLVVVVAVVVVALVSRQSASRELARFVTTGNRADLPLDLVEQLKAFYAQRGSWEGVAKLFARYGFWPPDRPRPRLLLLTDPQGRVIAYSWGPRPGERLPPETLGYGLPVKVNGQVVGVLFVPGARLPLTEVIRERLGPEGQAAVKRVQEAILLGGLFAGGVALVLAGLLAWGLVRPMRRLKAAVEGIARGDLSQRVPVTGDDELAELAATFNYMAAELERADRLRRNMTADVAHELRTPLSIIRGKLEGILDGVYPATPEQLAPVLEATELLTYLVEDLRLLAQAEAGQLALNKQPMDVGDLLRDTQVNFEPQASDRGVTLALDLPADLPPVLADWHRLTQVLGNLMTNALRHTPPGGCVTLSASGDARGVRVTVSDTGTGIPAEELPYVFERFWRGDKSRARAGGGSGLGLAIAKQIVELHGGTIGIESQPGVGTTVWFTLPVAPPEASAPDAHEWDP